MQSARGELLKTETFIKCFRLGIDRVDQYGARPNNLRGGHDSVEGVFQQCPAKTTVLFHPVDGQTRQQYHGDRIVWRHLGGNARRQSSLSTEPTVKE